MRFTPLEPGNYSVQIQARDRSGQISSPPLEIPVRPETVGRYRDDKEVNYFDFLAPAMREYGYEIPAGRG